MKNRIDLKFAELERKKKKAFIAFITAGYPSLNVTEQLVLSFESAGVNLVELGVPFSDPLAEGSTIQAATQQALEAGVTLDKILAMVKQLRKKTQMPIALMTYFNPIFHQGEDRFIVKAKKSGVDGLIIPDLPPEEAETLMRSAKRNNLSTTFFLAPTTTKERMKKIVTAATGFIYYVSLTGVTGARKKLSHNFLNHVRMAKRLTNKPVCVGFGVSTPSQVESIARIADGVIVGSAIIKEIQGIMVALF